MKKQVIYSALVLTALSIPSGVSATYDPHPANVTYTEDYRGQYHFSPKSEWMNDVNALMYFDGQYHMIYQWGKKIRHGGYATSGDLLHWTDRGVALIPQKSFLPKEAKRNVTGDQVYSGSGVVVSGQTAQKITGSEQPAMVAIYTGTTRGTCLAWSQDSGKTWHDYPGNPVGNPTQGANPRDPAVFWHAPSQKWILAIYEKGTTFYGSKDLIDWEYLSHIQFGYECPDMYELPVDGDADPMKWVLQDANGSYLVGDFDGKSFTPIQEKLIMNVGPDFYAAQTFFRPNLPGNKVIQIAWNDHWNGGIGEKGWERNATFPVEVGLITSRGKIRITRNPIAAIATIYESTQKWGKQILASSGPGSKNLLDQIHSKKFDLTVHLDLNGATAKQVIFQFANKLVTYDLNKHQLLGKELLPDEDHTVKIRFLVDWGQLEIFAAKGVFSYSQQFAFTPNDDTIALHADGGTVNLLSMEFHEIARTWKTVQGSEH